MNNTTPAQADPFACHDCNVVATVGEPYCDKHRPADEPTPAKKESR